MRRRLYAECTDTTGARRSNRPRHGSINAATVLASLSVSARWSPYERVIGRTRFQVSSHVSRRQCEAEQWDSICDPYIRVTIAHERIPRYSALDEDARIRNQ